MLASIVSLVITAGDPTPYFPTTPGISWTYKVQSDRRSQVVIDRVGKATKLLDKEAFPFTSTVDGMESEPTYYLVDGDTVYVIFRSYTKKEGDDGLEVRTPVTYQYPVVKTPGKSEKWDYVGKTQFMKTSVDMVLHGSSSPAGRRQVLGKDVECVRVQLKVMFGAQGEPPVTSEQSSLYGKGIGLIEMTETTTVNKQKYSEKRTLVGMTGDTR